MLVPRKTRRALIESAAVAGAIALLASASIAHAHGGMAGPDEIGPPLFTSFALGFVCYWLVILWPSSRSKDDPRANTAGTNKNRRRRKRLAAGTRGAHEFHSLHQSSGPRKIAKGDRIAGEGDHG
jgi:hypothetical protein